MSSGEATAAIAMAAGSILLLLAILSLPLLLTYLHHRSKRHRRNGVQPRYDQAIASLRQLVETRLNEGMIIAGEVWQLPTDNIVAGIFFDLIEDAARKLDKPVYFLNDEKTTTANATGTRLTKFRQQGLLAKAGAGQKDCWTVSLDIENGESDARTVNLMEMMSAIVEHRRELLLTRC